MENTAIKDLSPFKCVLLIDDDDTSLFISELIIKRNKFAEHTHKINNGDDALIFIEENCIRLINEISKQCPDLVFLDINMPGMDGFSVLESIKKMNLQGEVPMKIFMLSSSNNARDIEHANKLGVDGFINKPLNAVKLSEILNAA